MYLENAQRVFHAILHHSTVMQGSLFGILFIGLLANLPAILDSFFNNTTSDFIGVVGWGWWGATKWRGKTRQVVTPPYGPIGAVDSPKSSQISR